MPQVDQVSHVVSQNGPPDDLTDYIDPTSWVLDPLASVRVESLGILEYCDPWRSE